MTRGDLNYLMHFAINLMEMSERISTQDSEEVRLIASSIRKLCVKKLYEEETPCER